MVPESLPMLLLCPRLSSKQLTLPSAKLVSDSAKENILKYFKNISENKRILTAHLYRTQYIQFNASREGTPRQLWIKGKSFWQATFKTFTVDEKLPSSESNTYTYLKYHTSSMSTNVNFVRIYDFCHSPTCKFCPKTEDVGSTISLLSHIYIIVT